VIYALGLERLSAFYQQLLGMRLLHADAEHHVIESPDMQLLVHAIPPHIAATITLPAPVLPREDQSIKLFFTVPSLAAAEALVGRLGGALFGPQYPGPGITIRNGHDPEGNVFQLRMGSQDRRQDSGSVP
jgi:predicted enzyme related to lactoylglutathione lyase